MSAHSTHSIPFTQTVFPPFQQENSRLSSFIKETKLWQDTHTGVVNVLAACIAKMDAKLDVLLEKINSLREQPPALVDDLYDESYVDASFDQSLPMEEVSNFPLRPLSPVDWSVPSQDASTVFESFGPERESTVPPPSDTESQISKSLAPDATLVGTEPDKKSSTSPTLATSDSEIDNPSTLVADVDASISVGLGRKRKSTGGTTLEAANSKRVKRPARKTVKVLESQVQQRRDEDGQMSEFIVWPEGGEQGEFQRTLVECDKCDRWYHYGCVGITPRDTRLRPDANEIFVCPPCAVDDSASPRHSTRISSTPASCARPHCLYVDATHDEYVVERLIGRKPAPAGRFLWLIKWDGWPTTAATWTPEKNMGDFVRLAAEFYETAEREGIEIINDDATVLLHEASQVGWRA